MSTESSEWDWSLTNFVGRTANVAHAVVVSADGLLVARSGRLPTDRAEQLAAVISGLVSLMNGAARCFEAGQARHCVVEMERGTLLVNSIDDGSSLGVLAALEADLGLVGYEIEKLARWFGRHLTPDLRGTPPAAEATA